MQVIQLPRLEGLKTIVFSQRLLAFNETFAPVGKHSRSHPVVACLWDESTSGRSADDLMSSFHRVIIRFGKMQRIVFWLDNCAAQNKNWKLFLHLILLINSNAVQVKELVLKFFESGHTFMAADSFHAAVEKQMKISPPVTFPDFKEVVVKAKKEVEVLDMTVEDIFQSDFSVSQYTLNKLKPRPYIDNIRQVVIRKGSFDLEYSNSLTVNSTMKRCNLFSKKQQKFISVATFDFESTLNWNLKPRGIDAERKRALLRTILPLIEEEKKGFWNDLAETDDS